MPRKQSFHILFVFLLLAGLLGAEIAPALAAPIYIDPLSTANDLIAAVNELRASNGLAALKVNSALMAAAQSHSNYQATTGQGTHTGSGGSRPVDRASAAGYGGGASIFISENIAWGGSMNVSAAIRIWQGDSLHLNTMLGSSYTDAGAGVATSGGNSYFTLDVGYVAGSPGPTRAPGTTSPGAQVTFLYDANPFMTVTPQPDGAIVHTVQEGQALWNISAAYGVTIDELLKLNNLTNTSVIFVGQKILVRAAGPAMSNTPAGTDTPAPPTPTRTRRPTMTARPDTPTGAAPAASSTPAAGKKIPAMPKSLAEILQWAIIALVGGGLILMLAGGLLNRRG
jgi:LysM repeat protein